MMMMAMHIMMIVMMMITDTVRKMMIGGQVFYLPDPEQRAT